MIDSREEMLSDDDGGVELSIIGGAGRDVICSVVLLLGKADADGEVEMK